MFEAELTAAQFVQDNVLLVGLIGSSGKFGEMCSSLVAPYSSVCDSPAYWLPQTVVYVTVLLIGCPRQLCM